MFDEKKTDHRIWTRRLLFPESHPDHRVILVTKDINLRIKTKKAWACWPKITKPVKIKTVDGYLGKSEVQKVQHER